MLLRFLPLVLLMNTLISCNREDERHQKEMAGMWDCHHARTWDSAGIAAALQGRWQWIATASFWTGAGEVRDNVVAEFAGDSVLRLSTNGRTAEHSWRVVVEDGTHWGIDVTPAPEYFYGRIQFCDDKVLFNHSYIDGSDNFFRRLP